MLQHELLSPLCALRFVAVRMLSLDNLFAFYLVFRYYKLRDAEAQNKVLRWGIVGAVVLRALMVTPERLPLSH